MRKINLNLVIFILAISAVGLLKGRRVTEDPPAKTVVAKAVTAKVTAAPKVGRTVSPVPVVTVVPKVGLKPERYAQELATFSILQKKIFLTPAEELTRKELLTNENVLRGMRGRLLRPPLSPKDAQEQNAAIDLLLEAVRSGDNEVAVEVLRTVVTDGQIEDKSLDRGTRENLAGIKAEVLFQWSALKPAQASEFAGLLPGPVSQKIWANVVEAQQSNLSESAALAP